MSNALPMALLRPSCTALRSSAPITQHWNPVTQAFARRFCSSRSYSRSSSGQSLLTRIQSHNSPSFSHRQHRSFSSTPPSSAKVEDVPRSAHPTLPSNRKRTIRIGQLPGGEVDKQTIRRIFGPEVSTAEGNNVLRILHHRRTSGSLADYGVDQLPKRYAAVTHELALKALEWLREEFPIDEARAAEEWAEREANRIAYELWLADPENAGSKYNDPARVWREQQKEIEGEQEEEGVKRIGMLHQGPSEFERNIERKRRQRLEAIAKEAEEKEKNERENMVKLATGEWVRTPSGTQVMKPGQEAYVDVFGREQVSRRKEIMEEYRKKAVVTSYKSVEEMRNATTLAQRLVPMTAFVLAICLLSYSLAHIYEAPSPEYRLWPNLSLTTATLLTIITANIAICAAFRFVPLWPFMTRWFMHAPGAPRAAQALANVFAHVQYEHLIANMAFLALVGSVCHDLVGRGIFLGTYLSAGAFGTLASLYWANIGRGNFGAHSVGASAAIWGIAALYCLLTEQETLKVPFVKDKEVGFYPKMVFAAFVAFEVFNASKGRIATQDHASHFGGMAVGMVVAGYLRWMGFRQERGTVDVGRMVKEEVGEIKEGVKEGVKGVVKSVE